MEKFLSEVFGTTDLPTYMAWFVLAFIGALIKLIAVSIKKYQTAEGTPRDWSLRFFLRDNGPSLVLGFLITFVALRFSFEWLEIEASAWWALLVGVGNEYIASTFLKFSAGARVNKKE